MIGPAFHRLGDPQGSIADWGWFRKEIDRLAKLLAERSGEPVVHLQPQKAQAELF
jgi:hypothetical protein